MPIITVAIPVYNGAKTIRATLDSILQQSLADIEIVVIDDGSTDDTVSVVRQIDDSRIRLMSYPNQGLAASRNRGIQQSQCEFISFIDADDLWTPDKLRDQLAVLRPNPTAAVAYSWTDCVDCSGDFCRRGSHISAQGNVYDKLLLGNFLDSGSNALFRKSVFDTVGQFDESLKAAEDWDMFLRIACDHEFMAVSNVQVLYRLSAQSMSTNLSRQEQESLRVLKHSFARRSPMSWVHKRKSYAQLYRYLNFKSLENCSTRKQALRAGQYLATAVFQDPLQLKPIRLFTSQLSQIIRVLL